MQYKDYDSDNLGDTNTKFYILGIEYKTPIVNHTKRNHIFVETISMKTEEKENRLVILIHLSELFAYR